MSGLLIKDLVIDYGVIRAVKGVNIEVKPGTIVAILGANGAGKSSLIRSVSGAVKVKSGKIIYDDESITNLETYKIAQRGILQSPEGRHILMGLTVEENLRVGAYSLNKESLKEFPNQKMNVKSLVQKTLDEVYAYFPVLKERRKQQASTLSGGEQQMLAIGRALMGRPKLLLLDEPSLGLAPIIVREIFHIIDQIRKTGKTVLIVEQNAYQTLKLADYAYVLELGKVVKEGTGEALLKDEELINAYLGK